MLGTSAPRERKADTVIGMRCKLSWQCKRIKQATHYWQNICDCPRLNHEYN
jgi:hypothetical protein